MRKMKFKHEYLRLLIKGKKRSTIRLERKYKEGEVVYISDTSGKIYGKAKIIKILEKSIKNLTRADAIVDGFEDVKALKNALSNIYGRISGDRKIYIYYLEILGWWREV